MMVTLGIPYTLSPGHSGVLGRDGCPNAALRPLLELGDDLLVRRGERGRRWGCLWGSVGRSIPWTMSVNRLIARRSADADLLTSCLITSSRLVIRRRRPFSVRLTFSSSASLSHRRPRNRPSFWCRNSTQISSAMCSRRRCC